MCIRDSQFSADSGQGDAMGELFAAAKKCIGMTATLINGYASGIFYLLYRMCACPVSYTHLFMLLFCSLIVFFLQSLFLRKKRPYSIR